MHDGACGRPLEGPVIKNSQTSLAKQVVIKENEIRLRKTNFASLHLYKCFGKMIMVYSRLTILFPIFTTNFLGARKLY